MVIYNHKNTAKANKNNNRALSVQRLNLKHKINYDRVKI